jgi:hypothetical protein
MERKLSSRRVEGFGWHGFASEELEHSNGTIEGLSLQSRTARSEKNFRERAKRQERKSKNRERRRNHHLEDIDLVALANIKHITKLAELKRFFFGLARGWFERSKKDQLDINEEGERKDSLSCVFC